MFNHVLSIAAFGVVAFVLVFVHPGLQAGRAIAQQADAAGKIAATNVAAPRPRLAASK
jgi:hypothetical protein